MQLISNILVAADASGESVRLVKSLLKLPVTVRPTVTLLHVIPNTQLSTQKAADKKAAAEGIMASAKEMLADIPDITVDERLIEGDPKTTVLKVSDEVDASLIVTGGRSMNRLVAILSNSLSQYVFQLSTRPLLLIKEGLVATSNLSRIMVAVDGSQASKQALANATNLLRDVRGGELLIARVDSSLSSSSNKPSIANPEQDDPLVAEAVAQAKQAKLKYRVYFSVGDPGREIAMLSGESGADLLLMGSPDRRPTVAKNLPDLERLLGKSVSDYVRVHAQCPVLMTRPQV